MREQHKLMVDTIFVNFLQGILAARGFEISRDEFMAYYEKELADKEILELLTLPEAVVEIMAKVAEKMITEKCNAQT